MNPVINFLIQARDRIADPRNWCRNALAMSPTGAIVSSHDDEACCWCLAGALAKTNGRKTSPDESEYAVYTEAVTELEKEMGLNIIEYNDTHTHAEIIAAMNRTITRLQSESVSCPTDSSLPPSPSGPPCPPSPSAGSASST